MVAVLMGGVAHAARPMRGTYSIPVQDPALEPYSEFPVKFKADHYEAEPEVLEFPLPVELVGAATMIRLERLDPAAGTFIGEGAEGRCERSGRMLICHMAFSGLSFDSAGSDAAIDAQFGGVEASSRKQVAAVFRSQPIGILKYRLRGRSHDDLADYRQDD
jgi:hypothetical protein